MRHKVIIIDFYMQHCPYCYYILNDFNKLIDDMTREYGAENIAFIKIDGPNMRKATSRYGVSHYPTFIAIEPNTDGNNFSTFTK